MTLPYRTLSRVLAMFLACSAAPLVAQSTATIPERPTCKTCSVVIKPIVLLGSDSDPAGFALNIEIAAGPGPAYFVSSGTFTGEIYMYDAKGKFVKSIGKKGEGPGEMSRPVLLALGAGDSIHAIEMGSNRHHVISAKGVLTRSTTLRDPVSAFAAARDGTLFTASRHASNGTMMLLDRVAADGSVIAAFEPANTAVRTSGRNFVAVDPSGDLWSLDAERLRVTHWGKNNERVAVLSGKREWFTEGMPPQGQNPMQVHPVAWMAGMAFASNTLLIYYLVPDAKWAPMEGPLDLKRIYDTRIEVIDPRTGALLAVKQLDDVYRPIDRDRAYTLVEDDSGNLRIQVVSVSVTR